MLSREELKKKHDKILGKCGYLEIKDGWIPIIDGLCDEIQAYIDNFDKPQVYAVQVKQKFGELRFYTERVYDWSISMIDVAISISRRTCEECGSMDNIGSTKSWIFTICKNCKDLDKYKDRGWEPKNFLK